MNLSRNIIKELEEYREGQPACQRKANGESLNKKMRYAHIWIPPERREVYNEDQKAYVSINTAAVKHILLASALEHPKAFTPQHNMELVIDLMQQVFQELGSASHFSSPHALLSGLSIPHLSILASQEDHKMKLAMAVKEQCRTLKETTMSKVSTECKNF